MINSLSLEAVQYLFIAIKGVTLVFCFVIVAMVYFTSKAPKIYRIITTLLVAIVYSLMTLALSIDGIAPFEMQQTDIRPYLFKAGTHWAMYNLLFLAFDKFLAGRQITSLRGAATAVAAEASETKRVQPRKMKSEIPPVDPEAEVPFTLPEGFEGLAENFDLNVLNPLRGSSESEPLRSAEESAQGDPT